MVQAVYENDGKVSAVSIKAESGRLTEIISRSQAGRRTCFMIVPYSLGETEGWFTVFIS